MVWIALGSLALVLLLAVLNAFAHARVEQVRKALVWTAGGLGTVLLLVLLWSGRGFQALWSLALFGPALLQAWRSWRAARRFSRPGQAGAGQETRVETATLAMVLHHESGRMTGTVRRGHFAGADLADLGLDHLLELLRDCAGDDPESVPLLEAWLDRAHPNWRDRAQETTSPPPGNATMTRAEALQILGLEEGAAEEDIQAAYRRLMRAAHPDQGGSAWMAARLNAARDHLLGK